MFTLGSLFDGSGGFPLAGSLCGIKPVWASEVEPYPIAVTRSRFPDMKHLGDISKINGGEVEPVDIITFGSPCQDLSIAGRRAGLKHEDNGDEETTRSGLFMEAVRIAKQMRKATNGKYPRFMLWENVPGAFSSNKGADFRVVLEELIRIVEPDAVMPPVPKAGWAYADCYRGNGWSLAYRVFDAQYWGVPQRRRRIHLVLDLGGECAREILFEREGLRGYFAQSGASGETVTRNADDCAETANREGEGNCVNVLNPWDSQGNQVHDGTGNNVYPTLRGCGGAGYQAGYVVAPAYSVQDRAGCPGGGKGMLVQENCATSLRTSNYQYIFQPVIAEAEGFDMYNQASTGEVSRTLKTPVGGDDHPVVCVKCYESHPMDSRVKELEDDVSPTVSAKWHKGAADTPLVCYSIENHPADSRVDIDESGKVQTLTSRMGTGGGNVPMVLEAIPIHDQATRFSGKRGDNNDGKGNGLGVGENGDPMNTLTSGDRHAVVYAIEGNGSRPSHQGNGYSETDTMYTLNTIERHAVAYSEAMTVHGETISGTLMSRDYKGVGRWDSLDKVVCQPIALDRAFYNQGQNALYEPQFYTDGTVPTLVAKGPGAVCVRYIVRRLSPTECARLQGFADRWGGIDPKDEFTDEEYQFWLDVRNTHAEINGKAVKEYTKAQMLTWYNKLGTDSAEYKMWGNGIALPPALYCMQGMRDALCE